MRQETIYKDDDTDWNQLLRAAWDLPAATLEEKITKTKKLQQLCADFVKNAQKFGKLIIEEGNSPAHQRELSHLQQISCSPGLWEDIETN